MRFLTLLIIFLIILPLNTFANEIPEEIQNHEVWDDIVLVKSNKHVSIYKRKTKTKMKHHGHEHKKHKRKKHNHKTKKKHGHHHHHHHKHLKLVEIESDKELKNHIDVYYLESDAIRFLKIGFNSHKEKYSVKTVEYQIFNIDEKIKLDKDSWQSGNFGIK